MIGVQKQILPYPRVDTLSIQSIIETGLAKLNPTNEPHVCFSSRTDAGVHAICNTAHVDLNLRTEGQCFDPNSITYNLNKYFRDENVEIRVQDTVAVSPDFHARFCTAGRSYLYRIGVLKEDIHEEVLISGPDGFLAPLYPLVELNRLFLITSPFDIELFKEGLSLIVGSHDFASFIGNARNKFCKNTVREVREAYIVPGRPLFDPCLDPLYGNISFYDVHFHARSFLYKQVRKTTGVLVALAQGLISISDVQHMLRVPSRHSWNHRAVTASAGGLYLVNVHYPGDVFDNPLLYRRDLTDASSSFEQEDD